MAKRIHFLTLLRRQEGQISIFFSASLMVLVSIVAFVINIGLFVKAKINLQNATDAAAFSGAATQARQLTKIAYLNWEMRNIYKEWMFKYYVIGNLNVNDVANPSGGGAMSFRLETDQNVLTGRKMDDQYNIPAVCIHIAGNTTNICKKYAIPGLPEFGSSEIPGAEEASRIFMNSLIQAKVLDCVDRSSLNMLVANTWTYNVLVDKDFDATLSGEAPAILADRQGAWPRAVELAMRMRNLEYAMNRPAQTDGVCKSGSTEQTECSTSIGSIIDENKLGNERLVKAFYSGYRNLGNSIDNEMKESFTLTEIPPKIPELGGKTSASYLLVPQAEIGNYKKQWVDLKLMMVNYAIFYAAMIPRADSQGGDGVVGTSGACDVTKVAIPVPGYPMGFYKNPDVVTYYAVKGQAEFTGMFNPFSASKIKLTAYAAAKPMGGRIGPMLFVQKNNQDYFTARTDTSKFRSVPYITSFDFVGTKRRLGGTVSLGEFEPGIPLPINFDQSPGYFWLKNEDSPIGGLLADASGIQFGMPNLVYDYNDGAPFDPAPYTSNNKRTHHIAFAEPKEANPEVGLYSKKQFEKFKGGNISETIGPRELEDEIARVRAPTSYEAANYLIPSPNQFNLAAKLDSFGFVEGTSKTLDNGITTFTSSVYAPLYSLEGQNDLLFKNADDVKNTIFEFMRAQQTGMDKYRMALNQAARTIFQQRGASGAEGADIGYERAARGVSDIDFSNPSNDQFPQTCTSMAGKFLHYYYGANDLFPNIVLDPSKAGCPFTLGDSITEFFSQVRTVETFTPSHYRMELSWPTRYLERPADGMNLLTGYMPGPATGVAENGLFTNPLNPSNTEVMRRNFYSTKFVSLDSLQNGGGEDQFHYSESKTNFVIYSEGEVKRSGQDRLQEAFKNSLDPDSIGLDLQSIKH